MHAAKVEVNATFNKLCQTCLPTIQLQQQTLFHTSACACLVLFIAFYCTSLGNDKNQVFAHLFLSNWQSVIAHWCFLKYHWQRISRFGIKTSKSTYFLKSIHCNHSCNTANIGSNRILFLIFGNLLGVLFRLN